MIILLWWDRSTRQERRTEPAWMSPRRKDARGSKITSVDVLPFSRKSAPRALLNKPKQNKSEKGKQQRCSR
ncbi:hypothetical protein [Mesorhizobium sp. M0847]|uniref:hypothetical protein n=1 Tax=unclassified Mesorhizobium TaxID=325217 RepID=UPI0033390850